MTKTIGVFFRSWKDPGVLRCPASASKMSGQMDISQCHRGSIPCRGSPNCYTLSLKGKIFQHFIEETLFCTIYFINFFQNFEFSPPKRPIFIKSCQFSGVGILGAQPKTEFLEPLCRTDWSTPGIQYLPMPIYTYQVISQQVFKLPDIFSNTYNLQDYCFHLVHMGMEHDPPPLHHFHQALDF